MRQTNHRHQQFWSISRDYRLGDPPAKGTTKQDCKTSEVLASHRLSFGNQSIRQLTIPTSSIRYLTNLVELRIPQNKLTHLPHSLFLMTQLEILNLESNRLDEHSFSDHWWRDMVNLRVAFLAGNRFRCLPPSLGRLPKLFYADVSDNPRLTYLPAELLFAPAIGTLAANRCSTAIAQQFTGDTPSTPSEDSQTLGQEDMDGNSAYQLFAACEEIRRNPTDFAVTSILLPALDSAPNRYMCTICDEPVFCSELAIVKMVERWDMPFAWQCCSAQCQHKAIAATVQQAVDAAKWDL
ncbi:hypothetical protein GGF42_009315 [Coemansia sp. RSA 2424]|nr:hypothetical protein GGF42_009315 [Coemansia sp. RSA 2424]